MLRQSLRRLAIAAIAAVAAFTLGPAPAAAVTFLTGCAELTKAGETYIVTSDIEWSSLGACFFVNADRITLDLAGHTIAGSGLDPQQGIVTGEGRTLTVVKNGTVKNFQFGILEQGSRATIRNVTATDSSVGILVGPSSLVKDCTAQRNGIGVSIKDNGQVEACLIEDNGALRGGGGLFGGRRMLITRNIVRGNGVGINVDSSSTVTHNTSNENALDGIVVGQKSLVTYNTVNDNGGDGIAVGERSQVSFNTASHNDQDGIQAFCPATITHNIASANGGLDINPIGSGCVIQNNDTTPPPPLAP